MTSYVITFKYYHINPKYWNILSHYNEIWKKSILLPVNVSKILTNECQTVDPDQICCMDVQFSFDLSLLHGCTGWLGSVAWVCRQAWICCTVVQIDLDLLYGCSGWLESVTWMYRLAWIYCMIVQVGLDLLHGFAG